MGGGAAGDGKPAFDLPAILGAGDDFLPWVAAFAEMHAADGVLVEHLGDAAFAGGGANPRIAALDFVLLPCGFGGGIVGGQLGAWGDFQAACVWQLDFALRVYGERELRFAGMLGRRVAFQAAAGGFAKISA